MLAGNSAAEMFNFRSPSFKKLGVDRDTLTNDDLIKFMLEEPRLIRRPVVRIGKNAYYGADSKVLAGLLTGD